VTALGIQPRLRVGIDPTPHFIPRTLSGAAVPPPRTAERPTEKREPAPLHRPGS